MLLDAMLIGGSVLVGLVLFFSKKSVGPIILALCAGAFLESMIGTQVSGALIDKGVGFPYIDTAVLVSILLTFLPAMLISPFCVKSHSSLRRLFGAAVVAVLVASLMSNYAILVFAQEVVDGTRSADVLLRFQPAILGFGVLYAIFDFIVAHAHLPKHGKKH